MPLPSETSFTMYTVQAGDTCQSIANTYALTIGVLFFANSELDCANLAAGQVLLIPLALTATPLPVDGRGFLYVVRAGDTCEGIAAAFGVPLEVLVAANDLTDCLSLTIDWVLVIPLEPAYTPTPPPIATPYTTYIVQAGDTCQSIAASYGLPLDVLLFHNGLSDCATLTVGQVLVVPLAPLPSPTPCQVGCPGTPAPTVPPRPT
jgi:LysM repeat protein